MNASHQPRAHTCPHPDIVRQRGLRRPITPGILDGRYPKKAIPVHGRFAYHCERLRAAFPQASPRHQSAFKQAAKRLFRAVEERSEILDHHRQRTGKLIPLLLDFAKRSGTWHREPETWDVNTEEDAGRQLLSLMRHLFVRWQPPRFFDALGEDPDWRNRQAFGWLMHLASGGSLRTLTDLPLTLTKRAAHFTMQAHEATDVYEAFLWGVLRAESAPTDFILEVLKSGWIRSSLVNARFLGDPFPDLEWLKVLARMYRDDEAFDLDQVIVLMDYLTRRGFMHPICRLKGQTVASLQRRAIEWARRRNERWHRRESERQVATTWDKHRSLKPYHHGDGLHQIIELCNSEALSEEGNLMRHCVGSYTSACVARRSSIWSLRAIVGEESRPLVTIEVQPRGRHEWIIAQARAKGNRRPPSNHQWIISKWAERHGLHPGSLLNG